MMSKIFIKSLLIMKLLINDNNLNNLLFQLKLPEEES